MQNGELYNHVEIRDRLVADGHSFRSRCDTEILPHLYERYGDDFPKELYGMYGLAIWDERRRRAVIARDRLGIKPLYFSVAGDLVVFASELKSLLASGLVDTALDYDALDRACVWLPLRTSRPSSRPPAAASSARAGHFLCTTARAWR